MWKKKSTVQQASYFLSWLFLKRVCVSVCDFSAIRLLFLQSCCHKQTYFLVLKTSGLLVWLARIRLHLTGCIKMLSGSALWQTNYVPTLLNSHKSLQTASLNLKTNKNAENDTLIHSGHQLSFWIKVSVWMAYVFFLKCSFLCTPPDCESWGRGVNQAEMMYSFTDAADLHD